MKKENKVYRQFYLPLDIDKKLKLLAKKKRRSYSSMGAVIIELGLKKIK